MHEDVQEARKALPIVRRFLVRHHVTWTNLVSGQGSHDIASAYRVEEIPANFLVGRDGKIVALEQDVDLLEQAVIPRPRRPDPADISIEEISRCSCDYAGRSFRWRCWS